MSSSSLTVNVVAEIRARLEEVGAAYEWHEVDAQHAFLRDEGPRFDPALFLRMMDATLAFYRDSMIVA